MADKKISQLTGAATPLAGTEVLPVVQSGSTVKVSVADLTAGRTVAVSGLTTTGNLAVGTVGSKLTFDTLGSAGSTYLQTTNDYDLTIFNGRGGNPNIVLHNTDGIQFKSGSTLDMSVKSGNLVIGTAGKGIDFSANTGAAGMTSQLFDDYEEGVWVPTDTSGAGLTLTVAGAYYTKVGRVVTLTGRITYPSTVNGAQASISIPFATLGPTAFVVSTNYPNTVTGYANVSSMFFYLDAQGTITNASASTVEFNVSFTYIV